MTTPTAEKILIKATTTSNSIKANPFFSTFITLTPSCFAISIDPSVLPLSAIITSPSMLNLLKEQ